MKNNIQNETKSSLHSDRCPKESSNIIINLGYWISPNDCRRIMQPYCSSDTVKVNMRTRRDRALKFIMAAHEKPEMWCTFETESRRGENAITDIWTISGNTLLWEETLYRMFIVLYAVFKWRGAPGKTVSRWKPQCKFMYWRLQELSLLR